MESMSMTQVTHFTSATRAQARVGQFLELFGTVPISAKTPYRENFGHKCVTCVTGLDIKGKFAKTMRHKCVTGCVTCLVVPR
jgi:hypothetical protein